MGRWPAEKSPEKSSRGSGFIGFVGFIGLIGLIGFIGFLGFVGFLGFMGFRKNLGVRIRGTLGDTLNKSPSKRAQAT